MAVKRRGGPTKGELREEAILDATRRLVTERPLAEVTIDDIAAAAGITRTAFYFYFPTKQAVIATLLDQVWERFGQTHGWLATTGPSVGALREQLRQVAGMWQENSAIFACVTSAVGHPHLDEFMGRAKRRFVDKLAEKIRRDGVTASEDDAAALARMVAVVRDHRISEIVELPEASREAALEELSAVILRMVYSRVPADESPGR